MTNTIIYEFPLNEKMRNFMRIDCAFQQVKYFSHHQESWDSQACIFSLLDVVNIIERNDIRTDIIQELERNHTSLSHLLNTPAVNFDKLQNTLSNLEQNLHRVQRITGKLAINLREDDLLNSIKQRMSVSAAVNKFDIPSLYYWLNLPLSTRQERIQGWMQELSPIEKAISLLLELVRGSAIFESCAAQAGFFQKSLNAQQTCQMIRVELDEGKRFFPEFSGSKHRINVRFLEYIAKSKRPQQVASDVKFNLSCCNL